MIVDQCIEEYGSGLNYNRKKWNELLDEVMEQKIKTIVITHRDRFVRFGYDWFERFCAKFNATIVVIIMNHYHHRRSLYRISFPFFMCFLADCMDFVSIKNK